MGTLKGFAPPFGPPPATPTPLASLGLARWGAAGESARGKRAGRAGWAARPEGPAGSPRDNSK